MRRWPLFGLTALAFAALASERWARAARRCALDDHVAVRQPRARRYRYLAGVLDGRLFGITVIAGRIGPTAAADAQALQHALPHRVERDALAHQIDRVYRDPLNVNLSLDAAAFIAA